MRIGFDAKRAFNNNTGLGNYSRFIIESLSPPNPQRGSLDTPENEYVLYTNKLSNNDSKAGITSIPQLVNTGLIKITKDNIDAFLK